MSLTKCHDCGMNIASTATKCPHCDSQMPHGAAAALGNAVAPYIGLAVGVIFLLSFLTKGCG